MNDSNITRRKLLQRMTAGIAVMASGEFLTRAGSATPETRSAPPRATPASGTKQFVRVNSVRLAYVDFGGDAPPLLALHGHFSCGRTWAALAEALRGHWRIIALDQRGHGWSEAAGDYSREAYINDAVGIVRKLNLAPAVLLGHSLGGVNAYQLAARYPGLVRALLIEDIGAVVQADFSFLRQWPQRFPSLCAAKDFLEKQGFNNVTYFLESLVEHADGWGFRFCYDHLMRSQQLTNGDWWSDWLASKCPALLLHGHKSFALTTEHARDMASRRPHTRLAEFPNSGHTIHDDDPAGFHAAVADFLASL